eukprot:COSAG02_NODE_2153_length_9654_cov_6.361905_6_plen_203_part_00
MVLGPFSPERRRPAASSAGAASAAHMPCTDASPSALLNILDTSLGQAPATGQKSMRLLVHASELTPPKVQVDAPDDSSSATVASPLFSLSYDTPWLIQSPGGMLSPSPPADNAVCYDANGWPASDAHLSPAYELSDTYTYGAASPVRVDESSNNPPLYDKSNWRSFEVCVNPPNATYALSDEREVPVSAANLTSRASLYAAG